MDIGLRIKSFRTEKKLTQQELADLVGITLNTVQKYESGERNPSPTNIKKIAQVLDVQENLFYNIELSELALHTIGDIMSILFLLDDKVGFNPRYREDSNGNIDPYSVSIQFTNVEINAFVARWVEIKEKHENAINLINNNYRRNLIDLKEYNETFTAIEEMYELERKELINDKTIVKE